MKPQAEQCPACNVQMPPGMGQIKHMTDNHPEIIEQRRRAAAAEGWED